MEPRLLVVDLATVIAIRHELEHALIGRHFGKIFQLSKLDLAIDFRLPSTYLFLSIDPRNPRAYLIRRKLRELEKASGSPSPFTLVLRKRLSGAALSSITQIQGDRILLFKFDIAEDRHDPVAYTLVAQLTGASANLFLLDNEATIIESARETLGDGQLPGHRYQPPPARPTDVSAQIEVSAGGLSERLDRDDRAKTEAEEFRSLAHAARNKLGQEIAKREKLLRKLEEDLVKHGDPDRWKRLGDLLLANTTTARRDGDSVIVTDYFEDGAPEVAVTIDENDSLTEAAEKFFRRYTKARNARDEIARRMKEIRNELQAVEARRAELEIAIGANDGEVVSEIAGLEKAAPRTKKTRDATETSGVRSFISSDGYEILVGKKAKDNDLLTFRLAKSLDTWMHAADYPGSHVVIRNPNRKEIPHRTLLEAAELAAFYSQGKSQPKAAVHYTQKKFVNKPKGAAPGLVSLASFKTVLVQPKIGDVKLKS